MGLKDRFRFRVVDYYDDDEILLTFGSVTSREGLFASNGSQCPGTRYKPCRAIEFIVTRSQIAHDSFRVAFMMIILYQ